MSMDKAVTYSPYTKKFYVGSIATDADFNKDSNYEPIAKLNPEKSLGDGRLEFISHEIVRQAERDYRAGVIDSPSITDITIVDLLQEVVNKEFRDYYAINAVTRIAVPKLQLKIPVATKYGASKKVPELVEAGVKQSDWTIASFDLWKNVAHVVASDEASLKGTIEPLAFNIDVAAGSLAKAANEQLVTEIETFTTAAKGDWGVLNAGNDFSLRNPLDDITAEFVTITNNDFRPNTITLHPRVASDYLSNTFINGYAQALDRKLMGVFPLDKFPGITAVVDPGFTNTVATLYDKSTMLLGEGPTVAEQYRNVNAGANGYIIRQFLQPLKVTNNAGRKMTSVSA